MTEKPSIIHAWVKLLRPIAPASRDGESVCGRYGQLAFHLDG